MIVLKTTLVLFLKPRNVEWVFLKYLEDITRAIKSRSKWKLIQQDFHLVFFVALSLESNNFDFLLLHPIKTLFHLKICYTKAFLDFYRDLLIIQGERLDNRNCRCSIKKGSTIRKKPWYLNLQKTFMPLSHLSFHQFHCIGLSYLTPSYQKFSHLYILFWNMVKSFIFGNVSGLFLIMIS